MTPEQQARENLKRKQQALGISIEAPEPEEISISNLEQQARERLKVSQTNLAVKRQKEAEVPPTAYERIVSQPFERAVGRQQATFGRIKEELSTYGDSSSSFEAYDPSFGTDVPSVLVQTLTNPVSLGFDIASNAIIVGAEEAISFVLPDSMEEAAKQKVMEFFQTNTGQQALEAIMSGEESWNAFKQAYPNEASNVSGYIDFALGVPSKLVRNFNPDLNPIQLRQFGMRRVESPLEGIDKDVYNIAYSTPSGIKTPEQARLTTGPTGVFRTQKQLATNQQLEVVDELISAGIRGNRTLIENLNSMTSYLDKLDESLIKLAKAKQSKIPTGPKEPYSIPIERLRSNIDQALLEVIEQNPAVFSGPSSQKRLKTLVDQYMSNLSREGNTVEGMIRARRKFDSDLDKIGSNLEGTKLNVNSSGGTAIRRAINKTIAEEIPEAAALNQKMSRVLSVLDNVSKKAGSEASHAFGRFIQELGLDRLVGGTAASIALSGPFAVGFGLAASPIVVLRNLMKTDIPAKGRALVQYSLRDVKKEIDKAIAKTTDPEKKKALLAQKPVVYAAFEAAARKLEQEYEETTKQEEQ